MLYSLPLMKTYVSQCLQGVMIRTHFWLTLDLFYQYEISPVMTQESITNHPQLKLQSMYMKTEHISQIHLIQATLFCTDAIIGTKTLVDFYVLCLK